MYVPSSQENALEKPSLKESKGFNQTLIASRTTSKHNHVGDWFEVTRELKKMASDSTNSVLRSAEVMKYFSKNSVFDKL